MKNTADLRSDTVTKPSEAMRAAMAAAEVGDDVLGDDPTVNRLQERVAELFAKQAALFVPSGSMANLISIRAATEHGDEIIADINTHSYNYEAGGPAAVCGCSMALIYGQRGIYGPADVEAAVRPKDSHFPQSSMVIVENTNNRGGGSVWPVQKVAAIQETARKHGLHMHIDGARLMNACVAAGCKPTDYTQHADSVSLCFSKGLGAPVGSIVAGTKSFIDRTHRFRKMFGGGMRQSGILAAAALYALEHNVERLADDHANTKRLAEAIAELPGLSVDPATVETNIVIFEVDPRLGSAAEFAGRLEERGVRVFDTAPTRIRAVTHMDVSRAQIDYAIGVFQDLCAGVTA